MHCMPNTGLLFVSVRFDMQFFSLGSLSSLTVTGPNDLSIVDATAIPAVLGGNGLPKGQCKSDFFPYMNPY